MSLVIFFIPNLNYFLTAGICHTHFCNCYETASDWNLILKQKYIINNVAVSFFTFLSSFVLIDDFD